MACGWFLTGNKGHRVVFGYQPSFHARWQIFAAVKREFEVDRDIPHLFDRIYYLFCYCDGIRYFLSQNQMRQGIYEFQTPYASDVSLCVRNCRKVDFEEMRVGVAVHQSLREPGID
jgi:hypothetical protein